MPDQRKSDTNRGLFALYIGFYAGFIWGFIHIALYTFKLIKVPPGFWIEPFYKHHFVTSWKGFLIGWAIFIVLSLLASLIYVSLFANRIGPWLGFGYGIVWWIIWFALLGPWFEMMKPIYRLDLDSILSSFCLFLIWGVFIGYSIALEFTMEQEREPQKA